MNNNDYINLIYENPLDVFIILILTAIIYLLIFKKSIRGIGDSLIIGYIACTFATFAVLFLSYKNEIDTIYTISFLLTEIAFLIGAFLISGAKIKSTSIEEINKREFSLYYKIFSLLSLIAIFFYFYKVGFLFSKPTSRLDVFEELGVFYWLIFTILTAYPIIVLTKIYHYQKKINILEILITLLCAIIYISIGAKSSILILFIIFYNFYYFYGITPPKHLTILLTIGSPIFIILTTLFILNTWEVDESPLKHIFDRLFLFGDTFSHGYNKYFLETLPNFNIFDYFIPGIKNKIASLFGYDIEKKFVFGFYVSEYYYKIDSGMGVNARHNIISFLLFGFYFGAIFSFLIGNLYRILRTYRLKNGWMINHLICLFNSISFQFFIDPSLLFGSILQITLIIAPILFSIYLISRWRSMSR